MTFDDLLSTLNETSVPFKAFFWMHAPAAGPYGTVSIDGARNTSWGNNHMVAQSIEGTVDLYSCTVDEDPEEAAALTVPRLIQQALDDIDDVTFNLASVQVDQDARRVHWQWVFNLVGAL